MTPGTRFQDCLIKLAPFSQLLKKNDKEPVQLLNEINRDLDKSSKLASKQPLPNKQLGLMTDARLMAAGSAIFIEGSQNQENTSVKNHMLQSHTDERPFFHNSSRCPYTPKSS